MRRAGGLASSDVGMEALHPFEVLHSWEIRGERSHAYPQVCRIKSFQLVAQPLGLCMGLD